MNETKQTEQKKHYKIIAVLIALILILTFIFRNQTSVRALEITSASTSGYNVIGGFTLDNGVLKNASIGVYVTHNQTDKANYKAENAEWTHNGTSWSSGTEVLYAGSDFDQQISAYYPYVQGYTGTGGIEYNLTAVQTADTMKADDLMYAAATKLNGAETSLTFNHLMTKMKLAVTPGEELLDGENIAKVEIRGLAAKATFHPEDGTLTTNTDTLGFTTAYYNSEEGSYEALVFPAQYANLTIVITTSNDRVFKTTVTCPNGELLGGYQYTVALGVGQDVVNSITVTADSWQEVTGGALENE